MHFDPNDPAFRQDPYPTYRMLREKSPLFYWPDWNMWFVSSFADCAALLREPCLGQVELMMSALRPDGAAFFSMVSRWILMLDPPDHTRLRALIHKVFTRRAVGQLRDEVQASANELLDRVQAQGCMNLINDFAGLLPLQATCRLLGLPASEAGTLRLWAEAIGPAVDIGASTETYSRAGDAAAQLIGWLDEFLTERRSQPQDDLISALLAVEEEGTRLNREELLATCALILLVGYRPAVNLIANGVVALMKERTQWERMIASPELVEGAVEEVARYDAPVQAIIRLVQEEFTLRGLTFHVGQIVTLLLGSANRDSLHFADADCFEISRKPDRDLYFGHGIHYCLGAPLARLLGTVGLTTLSRRCPNLALAPGPIQYRTNFTLRGPQELMVTF